MKTPGLIVKYIHPELFLKFATAACSGNPRILRTRGGRGCDFFLRVVALGLVAIFGVKTSWAVDYHVATAQQLQKALTLAADDGANNNIYLTNGDYTGNLNYNSTAGYNLVMSNEPGVASMQSTPDSADGGHALNITSSGTGTDGVNGITFSRNCGSTGIGARRVAAGAGTAILVNGCRFLSPTNTSGMGLELHSGLDANVTNCTATGNQTGGTGLSISGVTGNVTVQSCNASSNSIYGLCGGLSISGAGTATVTGSVLAGNTMIGGSGGGGAYCIATTILVSGDIFTENSRSASHGVDLSCSGTKIALSGNCFTGNSTTSSFNDIPAVLALD